MPATDDGLPVRRWPPSTKTICAELRASARVSVVPFLARRTLAGLTAPVLLGALLGTAGCSVFERGSQQGNTAGTISVNLEDTIRDLDSTTTTDEVSSNILVNVIEGLYRLDENARPVPAQAEKADISEDGLTYTFTLRDGIKWSNGDPVTSQDFKYAWLRVLDPDTASQYAYIISTFVEGAARSTHSSSHVA